MKHRVHGGAHDPKMKQIMHIGLGDGVHMQSIGETGRGVERNL